MEAQIRAQLLDPNSATFIWWPHKRDSPEYCGLVNARNRFGAFTGNALFVAAEPIPPIIAASPDSSPKLQTFLAVNLCSSGNGEEVRAAGYGDVMPKTTTPPKR
jgi:hypothetical protein